MLVTAIIIKVTSPGPLIFKQERVGLHNKTFQMYKFRSMVVQDTSTEKKGWTVKGDPRVTPIGRFIRKTSIDEMPQFFNVLKGDMSMIGPRPERPQFVEKFKEEIPRYMIKHQVRPGLTGWAQVNGYRGDTSIMEVSSQGLKLKRTDGISFEIGIFTNLAEDHIGPNEHKDFEEYKYCKGLLFKQCRIGIGNIDDPYFNDVMKEHTCRVETFGFSREAELRAMNEKLISRPGYLGTQFDVTGIMTYRSSSRAGSATKKRSRSFRLYSRMSVWSWLSVRFCRGRSWISRNMAA